MSERPSAMSEMGQNRSRARHLDVSFVPTPFASRKKDSLLRSCNSLFAQQNSLFRMLGNPEGRI